MNLINKATDYLTQYNIIIAILVTIISNFATELVISFIHDIMLPIIDKYNNNKIKTNDINLKICSFLISLIKFIIVLLLIFSFADLTIKK